MTEISSASDFKMKATLFLVLAIATTTLAGKLYYPETPLEAGMRRRPKIVGGQEAEPHSLPHQVGLFVQGNFCGGSLITKRFVLTAAHCAIDPHPVVVLGAHRIVSSEPEQVVLKGKKFIPHEHYSGRDLSNDIGVIELPQEVELNENIQLVKLAPPNEELYVGETGKVSGWGLAYSNTTEISPVLRVVESTLMNNKDCAKKFGFPILKTVICLDGSKLKGACNGDSGGPLTVKTSNGVRQVGVVSFGSSAGCEKGYPTAYTRVSKYIKWIKDNSDLKDNHN